MTLPEEAETLLPCPACRGSKSVYRESEKGRYVMIPCRWCDGLGTVTLTTIRKFYRWRKILARNALSGSGR